jgi:hypothetical protein
MEFAELDGQLQTSDGLKINIAISISDEQDSAGDVAEEIMELLNNYMTEMEAAPAVDFIEQLKRNLQGVRSAEDFPNSL